MFFDQITAIISIEFNINHITKFLADKLFSKLVSQISNPDCQIPNFSDCSKDCFEKIDPEKNLCSNLTRIGDLGLRNQNLKKQKDLNFKMASNSRVTLIPTIVLDWAMMQEKIYRRSWQKRFLFLCTFAYLGLSTSE